MKFKQLLNKEINENIIIPNNIERDDILEITTKESGILKIFKIKVISFDDEYDDNIILISGDKEVRGKFKEEYHENYYVGRIYKDKEIRKNGIQKVRLIEKAPKEYLFTENDAKEFAEMYINIHNKASKEFTKAFNDIGAKMWHADFNHPYKKDYKEYLIKDLVNKKISQVIKKTDSPIVHPLTVMDSYPESRKYRPILEKNIKKIMKNYENQWKNYVEDFKKNHIFK